MIILILYFILWVSVSHFLTGTTFYIVFLLVSIGAIFGILYLPQVTFCHSPFNPKSDAFDSNIFKISVIFLVAGIVMLVFWGVFPHYRLYAVECVVITTYTLIAARIALQSEKHDKNKKIRRAMECGTFGLLAFGAQMALHCLCGIQFSIRLILILLALFSVLCAYFYRLSSNKNSHLTMQAWGQALILACVLFMVINIQLDQSIPQPYHYDFYRRHNFARQRILEDGRWISGYDARPDENGEGTALCFDGWFHVSYFLEDNSSY